MSVQELLSMLNAKNVRFDVGRGGIPALTSSDISAAIGMAKLTRAQYCVMIVKYCGDYSLYPELVSEVERLYGQLRVDEGWRSANNPITEYKLSVMAVNYVVANHRCKECKGTMYVDSKPCPVCRGTGLKPLSGRQMASTLGVNKEGWSRTWGPRFTVLVSEINQMIDTASSKIGRKLFKEAG